MERDVCGGRDARMLQHEEPLWAPLVEALGDRLAQGFMWMHECELEDSAPLHAYKHSFTRRYLYLTEDGRAFEPAHCGRFAPIRLDFAIESALCGWWILSGWTSEDAQALREAVIRASELPSADS